MIKTNSPHERQSNFVPVCCICRARAIERIVQPEQTKQQDKKLDRRQALFIQRLSSDNQRQQLQEQPEEEDEEGR